MNSPENEPSLISRAKAGDKAAMEILFFRHRDRLDAYIKAHFPDELRGSWEPQDVLQDVWIRAMRGIGEFRPGESNSLRRWLLTIARHTIADRLKYHHAAKRKCPRAAGEAGDNDSVLRLLEELALYHRTPSKSAANHELLAALDSAITRRSPEQAEAIRLRYLSGMEVKHVAREMRRTAAAVSMLCRRGLDSLRTELRSMSLCL
jgi:RNA polymerase sigma-70 factor, ECF subfamily